jgi:hypothetical protein
VSQEPGLFEYLLVAPIGTGTFKDSAFSYSRAGGPPLNDAKYYSSTLLVTDTSIDVKIVNRKTGKTYIHDLYTKALTSR